MNKTTMFKRSNNVALHCLLVITLVLTSSLTISRVDCSSVVQPNADKDQLVEKPKEATIKSAVEPASVHKASPASLEAKSAAAAEAPKPVVTESKPAESEQEANARKGRSDPPPDKSEATKAVTERPAESKDKAASTSESGSAKSSPPTSKPTATGGDQKQKQAAAASASASASASKQSALAGKSSASSSGKSKLPANLGTVTSTGSGGPAHYMSKHDAYSAIAEKHGALAQDAMRKSDKRRIQHGFGGIQKASGIGDMLSPFKGVTDSGLARTLGASMRSIMKGKYSVPAYVASALLGAVALMAFYESPISPLPVPALPEPPVGRFPPELPSLPPGTQVPFRVGNQQQQAGGYGQYQRSLQTGPQVPQFMQQQQQQPNNGQQQVLFPGNSVAQQRQMSSPGPVQQLAANLLSSVGKQQNAQRKSAIDYDPSSLRSFFGSNSGQFNVAKLSSPINQQQHNQKQQNSFLSFFGLGGSPSSSSSASTGGSGGGISTLVGGSDIQQASGLANQMAAAAMSAIEPKGQSASGLSNSHVVNKVKSYFSRPAMPMSSSSSSSSGGHSSSSNPYDQYQRMSFVQALMKDTAFLPAFLVPSRKSSSSPNSSSSSSSSSSSPSSSSSSSPSTPSASSGSSASVQPAAARMQVDSQPSILPLMSIQQQQQQQQPAKRTSSSFGLMRAADRIAHALLDTFSSGIMQRSSSSSAGSSSSHQQNADRKSGGLVAEPSPIASATSLLTDIMAGYQGAHLHEQTQNDNKAHQQQQSSQPQSSLADQLATGRTSDGQPIGVASSSSVQSSTSSSAHDNSSDKVKQQAAAAPSSVVAANGAQQDSQQAHVRKTRSIGLEYPYENQRVYEQHPSKAAQINNLVDYVSDSYTQNRLLFNFVMNQVGLSQAVPYVEQILAPAKTSYSDNQYN